MTIKRFKARDLLNMSADQIWEIEGQCDPKEQVVILFDDKQEVTTTMRHTVISWYLWGILKEYPETPLLHTFHIATEPFVNKTIIKFETRIVRTINELYWGRIDYELMSEQILKQNNFLYNDLIVRLGPYVETSDATDYTSLMYHPDILEARQTCIDLGGSPKAISESYAKITEVLEHPEILPESGLKRSMAMANAPRGQILQCIGHRGKPTDVDSYVFRGSITDGFGSGIKNMVDFIKESRSGAKALMYQKDPIRNTEYFNRRLQILLQSIRYIYEGDCGTTNTLPWLLMEKDIEWLDGKYFIDTNGVMRYIDASKKQDVADMFDKVVQLRSPTMCNHMGEAGICQTCLGRLSYTIPKGSNIGHAAAYTTGERTTQPVLSVKHLDTSAEVKPIKLTSNDKRFVHISTTNGKNNLIKLNKELKGYQNAGVKISMILARDEVYNLTQAMSVKTLNGLSVHQISRISKIGIVMSEDGVEDIEWVTVSGPSRRSSLTMEMLEYLRQTGYNLIGAKEIQIDLQHWDFTLPAFVLPPKQINMLDFMETFSHMIECGTGDPAKKGLDASKPEDVSAYIRSLLDFSSQHILIPMTYLELVTLSGMVRSVNDDDYRLPNDPFKREFCSTGIVMRNRSIGPALSYEEQANILTNSKSFTVDKREAHPMDALFLPTAFMNNRIYDVLPEWKPYYHDLK